MHTVNWLTRLGRGRARKGRVPYKFNKEGDVHRGSHIKNVTQLLIFVTVVSSAESDINYVRKSQCNNCLRWGM